MILTTGNIRRNTILLCCFTVWTLLFACKAINEPDSDDAALHEILAQYRDVKFIKGDRAALGYTDSVLHAGKWTDHTLFELHKIKFGIYLFSFQQYDSAMTHADTMLAILQRNPHMPDYTNLLAQAHSAKGDAYYYSGRFRDAFKWYDMSSYSDIEGAGPCFNAAHNFRIAMTMYRTERYLQAAQYFKRSYLLYDSCGEKNMELHYRRQQVLDNIGLCYYKAGVYDSAYTYYAQTLGFIRTHEKPYPGKKKLWDYAAAVVYDNFGSLYAATGRPDSALQAFTQSLALSQQYPREHFHIHTKLAKLNTTLGRYDEAKKQLDIAAQILADGTPQEPAHIYDYKEAAWLYYRNTGNHQLANANLDDYLQLKDSLFVKQKDALIEELYAAGVKESQHRADIVAKNEKIRMQTWLTLLFVCTSALLAGGWLVRRIIRQKRKFTSYRTARAELEKKLKGELLQKERHLLSIMNSTDDLVWAVDTYFKLTTFNKAYDELIYNMTGKYAEVGKPSNIAAASPDMYEKWISWHKRAMAGEAFTVTDNVTGLKPEAADIEARFWPLHDAYNNVIGVGCLVRNITEYVENTRRIKAQNNALKEIAHMQSHEVRGPVATMKGLLHVLDTTSLTPAEHHDLLEQLAQQLDELDRIIHAINNKTM